MRLLLPAILTAILAGGAAAEDMSSESNRIPRSTSGMGGQLRMATANNVLVVGVNDEVAGGTIATANNRLGPGYVQIFTLPGAVTNLTNLGDVSLSSVTLQWTAPGLDGGLGSLPAGSKYLLRIASYTAPDTLATTASAGISIATQGVAGATPGAKVSNRPSGFIPNTTFYTVVWVVDDYGNASLPTVERTTFTTMARPITPMPELFSSVQDSTITLSWNKLDSSPPDASSKTSEGYVLEVSSTDFGALSPGGVVNSSVSYDVRDTTLTVAFPDPTVTTNYYRIGSLNWEGRPNYYRVGKFNFQVKPSATLITIGALDMTVAVATVTTSSMVVYNVGDTSATYVVDADTNTLGSSWTLGYARDVEVPVLQGVWNSGATAPAHSSFNTVISSSPRASTGVDYAGTQTGVLVPPGQNRTLWFRFQMPSSTAENGTQQLRVTVVPVKP